MITKNFQLNSLANQYSAAIYDHVKQQNGGDFFIVDMLVSSPLRIDIVGGASGVRGLVDAYCLEALKLNYPQWEKLGIALMSKCLDGNTLTQHGREIWESMGADMGSTVAGGAQ
ncbi:TPA: hypothetical protein PXJ57_003973 [Yersinia enterocolitica]|nr:hypothetical protein [Yersinia enterocolitica]HDL6704288.1 hypothetical protein [Yersinia enterocolitica]